MKNILALAFCLSLVLGCSSSSDSNSNSTSSVYDIEMTIKNGNVQNKYVDEYSYNHYQLGPYSNNPPIVEQSTGGYRLNNGYLYGVNNNGIVTGSECLFKLELGQNLTVGQIVNFSTINTATSNDPFTLDFGSFEGYGYAYDSQSSTGQVKITGNQNNKLSGEFTFNNVKLYGSSGVTSNIIITGKFKNMPIQ